MRARIIAVCLITLLVHASTAAGSACSAKLEAGPARSVVRIIDGETVGLDDGSELRLIGALAPRALDVGVGPGKWAAETRSHEALSELVLGKSFELKFDAARNDRYGRLQAQAFLIGGEQRLWIQQHLVSHGFARAYSLPGNMTCIEELLAAENAARVAGLGLWAEAAYQVRSASDPGQLVGYRTTFQLVEGQVVRAASVRGSIYLNFDRNRRDAFSVSLRRDDQKLLGTIVADPKMLEGRRVRVRGWIDVRDGPRIDLSAGGAVEVIPDPPPAAGLVSPR
jgi:endonuclease YncB( thermonuclease family)